MAESSMVWGPLKREFDRRGWHAARIENSACPGTPDVNVHIPGSERPASIRISSDVWIELKHIPTYSRCTGQIHIGLRKDQYIWLREAKRAGRSCYLLARVEGSFYLWNTEQAWQMAKAPCNVADIFSLICTDPSEDIGDIVNAISSMR